VTWTRRIFLKESLAGWIALVIGPTAYGLIQRVLPPESGSVGRTTIIGKVDEFQVKTSKVVYFGREKVIIGRSHNGSFHAVSAVCTHLGCFVKFEEENDQGAFACNCHNSKFDLEGVNLSGPAVTPLRQYKIEVVEGDVQLSGISELETF
jgi:cytochrome b6-f complex iron-sulfur subunit